MTMQELTDMIRKAGCVPVEELRHQKKAGTEDGMIVDLADKVHAGERLTFEDGVRLMRHSNLPELALLADYVRRRKHPDNRVTYVIGRNVNYTNVCWVKCKFCAFYRAPGSEDGYVLPKEVILEKIQELVDVGASLPGGNRERSCEVLMQGGLNPRLKLDYYLDLLSSIKRRFPQAHLHALSAVEVIYIAHLSRLSWPDTIKRLHEAGLDSIPGAGGEILNDDVRKIIAFRKDTTSEWLELHETAHGCGLNTTATMMYGSVETPEHRVEHLVRVRESQDRSLALSDECRESSVENGHSTFDTRHSSLNTRHSAPPGRYTAFICWNFQPNDTPLGDELTANGWKKSSGYEYLRTVAVSRLMLDNIDSLQASWVTQGAQIAQISLGYGVNDFGSLMMEENVVSAAGTRFEMPLEEMWRLIRDAGYDPARRNTRYELLQ